MKGMFIMKFKTQKEKEDFLQDKPFYKSASSYCLGNTMEEASEIIRKIKEEAERERFGKRNVELDC